MCCEMVTIFKSSILCQGTVAFSSDTGDRMALTMVEQLVNTSYQKVGYYDQRTDNLTFVTNTTTGEQARGHAVLWTSTGLREFSQSP